LGWLSYGLHVAVLVAAFRGHGADRVAVASIGGYALAWTAGLVAFVLPAGAGARDVTLVLALSGVVATNPAIAVAVVSRAVTTVCDVGLATIAGAAAVRVMRRTVPQPPRGAPVNDGMAHSANGRPSHQLAVEEVRRHVPRDVAGGPQRHYQQPRRKPA
jgi:glycosyltransferase 2 family protein